MLVCLCIHTFLITFPLNYLYLWFGVYINDMVTIMTWLRDVLIPDRADL